MKVALALLVGTLAGNAWSQLVPQDGPVLRAALECLIKSDQALWHGQGKTELVLISSTPEKTGTLEQTEYDAEPHKLPPGMAAALRKRNSAGSGFTTVRASFATLKLGPSARIVKPGNPNLTNAMGRLSLRLSKVFPKALGYFQPYLPAYSKDGNLAVVRGWFGPSAHSATVTFLLERTPAGWRVKWHRISYYV